MTSEILHSAFGLFCHQVPERSPAVLGTVILCYRCLGTFAGLLGAALAGHRASDDRAPLTTSGAWILSLAFVPLVIDGIANTVEIWSTPGLVRLLTGLLPGASLGILIRVARTGRSSCPPGLHLVRAIMAGGVVAILFLVHPWMAVFSASFMLLAGLHLLLMTTGLVVAGLRGPGVHSWYRNVDLR